MAIRVEDGYLCGYCKKHYTSPIEADKCKDSHNVAYVPLTYTQINGLLNFIFTGEQKLIDEGIIKSLQKALRESKVLGSRDGQA